MRPVVVVAVTHVDVDVLVNCKFLFSILCTVNECILELLHSAYKLVMLITVMDSYYGHNSLLDTLNVHMEGDDFLSMSNKVTSLEYR